MNLRKKLTNLKNDNLFFYYLWTIFTKIRGSIELKRYSDIESINNRYLLKSGRLPNVENPKLFSEKMQWLKLYYRDDLMTLCADKYAVRKWIEKQGYSETLNELYAVYDNVQDIDLIQLPSKFVLKASHGSGWNLIVNDKDKLNWFMWRKIMRIWLSHNIFWAGREWVYDNIKPRLVCEKFLEDDSDTLMDYKFHCFNGEPKFIQVNQGRGDESHTQNFYDLEWKLQPFGKDIISNPKAKILPPKQLASMIKMAKELSTSFPYARVDFYEVNEKIIFGEITFFPAGGYPDFKPEEYDAIWGEMLTLPQKNTEYMESK